jgi:hypothetical protein
MIKNVRYYFGGIMYNYHDSMWHKLHDKMNVMEFGSPKRRKMLKKLERHTKMMKLWLRFKWGDPALCRDRTS